MQVQHGWMCKTSKKYSSNAGLARGAFSVCPCVNTKHPTHVMNQNEVSKTSKIRKEIVQIRKRKEAPQIAELSLPGFTKGGSTFCQYSVFN